MEQMQAIISAAVETKSPVILQVSSGARKYANQTLLRYMAQVLLNMQKSWDKTFLSFYLDHGDSFRLCKSCIDSGFSSVMIDGSHHSFEKNVNLQNKLLNTLMLTV